MAVEENLNGSKTLYKGFLLLVKYIPILIAGCYVVNTMTCYFGLDLPVLSNISGVSLLTWIFMYVSAVLFKFCIYHKMFLYYILSIDLLNITDYYFTIPVKTSLLYDIHFGILGIFLFIILYLYVRGHRKQTTKKCCR